MRLVELDRQTKKRILVVGDALRDEYVYGTFEPSQDGCFKFTQQSCYVVPGGAANAARQLANWSAEVHLAAITGESSDFSIRQAEPYGSDGSLCLRKGMIPVKRRFVADGRIVWRHDYPDKTVLEEANFEQHRKTVLQALKRDGFDAVLISDYTKGFLIEVFIRDIIDFCRYQKIPVVADAKQKPSIYTGAIVKCNDEYATRHWKTNTPWDKSAVITNGRYGPIVCELLKPAASCGYYGDKVDCLNHVGAGDCFAAHLVLGLAHGLSLVEAATISHSAGRVYVQHVHNRPPHPFEIQRDLDPVGGKTLGTGDLQALRRSSAGRIVFANGCFRVPHAGHVAMLQWAKRQGDVLIVGINDDESIKKVRPDQSCLPLSERVGVLAALQCVDWIVPFSERDPGIVLESLHADVLVKGEEYKGFDVPGASRVGEVRFAPMVSDLHATKLLKS